MIMPPQVIKFLNTVSTRMHVLNDERNLSDGLTTEVFKRELKEDWKNIFHSLKIHPNCANNTVVEVDLIINWGDWNNDITEQIPLRFITQNPNKRQADNPEKLSKYAELAKEGKMITWIRVKGKFRGRIQSSKYISNNEGYDIGEEVGVINLSPRLHDVVMELSERLPHIMDQQILQMVQLCNELGVFND